MDQLVDEAQLRSTLAHDPWATTGVLRIKDVRARTLWLDARSNADGPEL